MLTYKPGRTSCEPFRKYNTQSNGIYGLFPKKDAAWQSFSNWCPGDKIDNRIIRLGAFSAGTHTIKISVPDAEFVDGQGDIPVSVFFQGLTEGTLPDMGSISDVEFMQEVSFDVVDGVVTFTTESPVLGAELLDIEGRILAADWHEGISSFDASAQTAGVYLLRLHLDNGLIITHKFMR